MVFHVQHSSSSFSSPAFAPPDYALYSWVLKKEVDRLAIGEPIHLPRTSLSIKKEREEKYETVIYVSKTGSKNGKPNRT